MHLAQSFSKRNDNHSVARVIDLTRVMTESVDEISGVYWLDSINGISMPQFLSVIVHDTVIKSER
jgi:hypothetical protein